MPKTHFHVDSLNIEKCYKFITIKNHQAGLILQTHPASSLLFDDNVISPTIIYNGNATISIYMPLQHGCRVKGKNNW